VHGIIYIASPYGIEVHVLQLLRHHLSVLNLLRMAPLLPKLMDLVDLVPQFEEVKFLQQRCESALFKVINDPSGSVGLESAHLAR
jgi:hypothetical protein